MRLAVAGDRLPNVALGHSCVSVISCLYCSCDKYSCPNGEEERRKGGRKEGRKRRKRKKKEKKKTRTSC